MFAKAGMGGRRGPGQRPALLVVDMTYAFVDSRFRLGCSETGYPAVASNVRLLEKARERQIPVFFTKGYSGESGAAMGRWKGGEPKSAEENEIVRELTPHPGEVVLPKRRPSAFFGTDLVNLLIYEQIDTLIVTGMTTSGCVRATVVDAFSYNYRVLVPHECVADRSQISHKVSLLDMHMKYADVQALDSVLAWLDEVSASPQTVR
ncbi:MAG: isochorismatase family protein [Alicyclobacillus sp.]|nr:isochorismatase family protein [Alicyclobacillus sp.]